jgi:hypothetical protein
MAPETDEYVFHGEIITPDFIQWMRICDLHQAFLELAKTYGRERAVQLWDDVAKEHSNELVS